MLRNRQRPQPQRDWREVERYIAEALRAAPAATQPVIMQAQVLEERGEAARAQELLAAARQRSPAAVELWVAEAQLLGRQRRYDEGLDLLKRAGDRDQLGDRIDLRLARAMIWVAKGGPEAVAALNALAEGLDSFPRESRRPLLSFLAGELGRQRDLAGATRLWRRLAEQEPDDLESRIQLLDLTLQDKDGSQPDIAKDLAEIERIDGSWARFFQALSRIRQAGRADDRETKERLRTEARAQLNELRSRRPDWALVPWALAQLEEQELAQDPLDEARRRDKQEILIESYVRAIDLGHHNSAVVRRAVQLLFAAGRVT
jgi:hypothetical protein